MKMKPHVHTIHVFLPRDFDIHPEDIHSLCSTKEGRTFDFFIRKKVCMTKPFFSQLVDPKLVG